VKRSDWLWFGVWLAIGALVAFAVVGAMTIGVLLAPVAVVVCVVAARSRRTRVGLPGLVSGLAVPLMYVAFLNHDGPGTVCTVTTASRACTDELNPWPWLIVAAIVWVAGLAMFARRRHAVARV